MKSRALIFRALAGVTLLVVLLGCASMAPRPETPGDAQITSQVKDAIFHNSYLRSSQIGVSTHDGVVRLTGVVEKSLQLERAAAVAQSVPGVVRVQNELTVKE